MIIHKYIFHFKPGVRFKYRESRTYFTVLEKPFFKLRANSPGWYCKIQLGNTVTTRCVARYPDLGINDFIEYDNTQKN